MRKIKVAINGFGRIGRVFTRAVLNHEVIEIVAINDLVDTKMLAHLMQYDTVHGKFEHKVSVSNDGILIGNHSIKVYSERNPEDLPWESLGIDIVIESTGIGEPIPIAQAFYIHPEILEANPDLPDIQDKVYVDAIITVVDSPQFFEMYERESLIPEDNFGRGYSQLLAE